jgi:hypothetical protein
MRLKSIAWLAAVILFSTAMAMAQEPARFAAGASEQPSVQNAVWSYGPGWNGYGYPGLGGYAYSPYNATPHFPYLYFYEQYAQEAEESRRAADEYEASLAREGRLTGPLPAGAFTTDYLPRSPLTQQLSLDGQAVAPSPSGAPLVIESGSHTLQIGAPRDTHGN